MMDAKSSSLRQLLDIMPHPLMPELGPDGALPEHPFVYIGEAYFKGWYEGRADMAREILLHLGTKRFGPPDTETNARLDASKNERWLRDLVLQVARASSWHELLKSL